MKPEWINVDGGFEYSPRFLLPLTDEFLEADGKLSHSRLRNPRTKHYL